MKLDRVDWVIYHGNCPDGMTGAWVASKTYGRAGVTFHAASYGQPLPEIPDGASVLMVDFSFPRPILDALAARCQLWVIDHHKTAQADLQDAPYADFDMERSGGGLAWDLLQATDNFRPAIVNYTEDRDLWRFNLPRSRAISMWVFTHPYTLDAWDEIYEKLENRFEECATAGEAILTYQRTMVDAMCANAVFRDIGGHHVPVVNASYAFSEVGERLCELYPDAPFGCYYFDRKDGMRQWGSRSRQGFDVSVVAKALGGGGHAAAAGWTEKLSNGPA